MLKLRTPFLNDYYVLPKVKYRVNLPLQMAECEANYARLKKLLPDMLGPNALANGRDFAVSCVEQTWLHTVCIVERSPYTTTLQLTQTSNQKSPSVKHSSWLQMPRLTVRMYHDAELAEVLAWEGHRRLRPRYAYPNQAMYQCDEKLQINQFLGEWLTLCLSQGHGVENYMAILKQ